MSVVTVAYDGYFFARLLVEKVREHIGARPYEIIVVDRGSKDGTREWLRDQADVRVVRYRQWREKRHDHGDAAIAGVDKARHEVIVLLDSDAHPVDVRWLEWTVDLLGNRTRLTGARQDHAHQGNPHRWYVHPHFMVFFRKDVGGLIELRKVRGQDTDTGEEATIRVLDAGLSVIGYPLEPWPGFQHPSKHVPTISAGVFHAWYVTRLLHNPASVSRETEGAISVESYLLPLQAALRRAYRLTF